MVITKSTFEKKRKKKEREKEIIINLPLTYGPFPCGFWFVLQKGLPFSNATLNAKGITNHSESIKNSRKSLHTWWLTHGDGPILAHLLTLRRQKGTPCTKTFISKWYPFCFPYDGCYQSLGQWHFWDGQNVTYIRVNR